MITRHLSTRWWTYAQVADAVTKLREICMALPDVSERAQFGDCMFYIGREAVRERRRERRCVV